MLQNKHLKFPRAPFIQLKECVLGLSYLEEESMIFTEDWRNTEQPTTFSFPVIKQPTGALIVRYPRLFFLFFCVCGLNMNQSNNKDLQHTRWQWTVSKQTDVFRHPVSNHSAFSLARLILVPVDHKSFLVFHSGLALSFKDPVVLGSCSTTADKQMAFCKMTEGKRTLIKK